MVMRGQFSMKNVVLIGFMGAGKTAVGRLLAQRLNMQYLDTDEMIEKREGRTINDIFAGPGESFFRDVESKILDIIADVRDHVISTGGGIILRRENVLKLKGMGVVVLLWADPGTIYERLKDTDDRPLLKAEDSRKKIKEILDNREPIYRETADHVVDTSGLSPEEACNRIMAFLKKEK